MGFNKPCIVCGVISRGTRCPTHQQELDTAQAKKRDSDPTRKERKRLLYNSQYKKQAQWVRDTATICHICNKQFMFGDSIEADHVEAGNPNSELKAAHRRCNASRGNRPLN